MIGINLNSIKQLLKKFRIPVSDVIVIPDINAPPSEGSKTWFDSMVNHLVRQDNDPPVNDASTGTTLTHILVQYREIRKKKTGFF